MFNPRVGPFCDFLNALSEVRPLIPFSGIIGDFHWRLPNAPSINEAAYFLREDVYQSMKGSGKILLRSLKRAIPSQRQCDPCVNGGRKCENCLSLNTKLKRVSIGLLSLEAVREYDAYYSNILFPFAQQYRKVYIVDVANLLRSSDVPFIVAKIAEQSNGDYLLPIRSHIEAGLPSTNPGDRIQFLGFFVSFMKLINRLSGYTAGFIFVNQCSAIKELGVQDGPHYKWINVSFSLDCERMHTITGFDGSDDAMMVEIHRRLRNEGIDVAIISEDRFSEYVESIFSPTRFSITPRQLAFPRYRPREWNDESQIPPSKRFPPACL